MNKILLVVGVVVLIFGFVANSYQVVVDEGLLQGEETQNPYDYLTIPLILAGVVLILVGLFIPEKVTHRSS